MQMVNSDADLLSRHTAQMASRFHHTTKILLTASPVWTQMTTAVDRAAVGHVVASTHGLLRHRIYPIGLLNVGFVDFPYLGDALCRIAGIISSSPGSVCRPNPETGAQSHTGELRTGS